MPEIQLVNLEGKVVGAVPTPQPLEGPVNEAVLWQAVRMYLANQRQGTSETKTRGQVSGGGKKPWRQKHTGRARAGSSRSPIWRKGGIVFGPHPREHRYALPDKLRRTALVNSLRDKFSSQAVTVVQGGLEGLSPKTKVLAQLLREMHAEKKVLLVVEGVAPTLLRISRNLSDVQVRTASDLTCYDVLASDKLVVTSEALKRLEALSGSKP